MVLVIDNYDSFTWNLVHGLALAARTLDRDIDVDRGVRVVRHDEVTPEGIESIDAGRPPTHIVISPGPCTPREAGVSVEVVRRFAGRVPILGVCLGHQCIASAFGMAVERHPPRHGRTSRVEHDGRGVFAGLPAPLEAMRYHSLAVPWDDVAGMRGGWEVSAWAEDGGTPTTPHEGVRPRSPSGPSRRVVMGLRRVAQGAPVEGVQFHPESYRTEHGVSMLANFLRMGTIVGP